MIAKYRGKRIDSGEWSEGNLIELLGKQGMNEHGQARTFIVDSRFGACIDEHGNFVNTEAPFVNEVDPNTVGQYIGISNSSGSDIFRGDIIKITLDTAWVDKEFYLCEVTYRADDGYPAFDLEPWIDCGMNALSWQKSESDPSVKSYEVVGNVHDHPHLLEGTVGKGE